MSETPSPTKATKNGAAITLRPGVDSIMIPTATSAMPRSATAATFQPEDRSLTK